MKTKAPRFGGPAAAGLLLLSLLGAAATAEAGPRLPTKRTPAADLEPSGVDHHEVLRIKPNGLGPADSYDIVIDAWTKQADGSIAGVNMWWLDRSKRDERSPFGKTVKSRIDVDYIQRSSHEWQVQIKANGSRFTIDVRAEGGDVFAYGTVATGGTKIPECRATSSKVIPTTLLGIPTGLDRLQVSCIDQNGVRQHGKLK